MQALYVAAGGACGATCRFLLSYLSVSDRGLPLSTFLANVIGCFLIGIIAVKGEARGWDENLLLFLKTGFCGGLTTFSTFTYETHSLFTQGDTRLALLYISSSLLLSICGLLLGYYVGSKM